MIKLTKEQVISIHSSLIEATGGTDGVRDIGLLESALEAPFQTFDGNAPSSLLNRLTGQKQKQQDNGYKIDHSLQIQCSGQES